jgi:hypothetical protein
MSFLHSRRRFTLLAVAGFFPFVTLRALTPAPPARLTCPVCRTEFDAHLAGSGTQTGMRLDFRPTGPIASPWTLPECPKCRNVRFGLEGKPLAESELKSIRSAVQSARFTHLPAGTPTYHRLAVICEAQKKSPRELAMTWLAASWQWESSTNRAAEQECRKQSARWLDRHLESKTATGGTPDFEAIFVRADLHRRAGEFEAADAWIKRWSAHPAFRTGLAPRMIQRQRELIAARISTAEPLEPNPGTRTTTPGKATRLQLRKPITSGSK